MFFAHSALNQPKSKWHYLRDHLVGSATRAKEVGSEFGAGRAAHLAALLHDLGKYTPAFQARLSGAEIQVDHSTAGAFEVLKLSNNESDKHFAKLIAFGIGFQTIHQVSNLACLTGCSDTIRR